MKYYAIVVAALTLTACGQPAATVAPVANNSHAQAPQAQAPVVKNDFRFAGLPDDTAVLVRYKEGRAPHAIEGVPGTPVALANTFRYVPTANKTRTQLLTDFDADDSIEMVEPDYRWQVFANPTDPSYSKQWDMAKIQLGAALDKTKGNANVIVASVDSGVDYNHPDLAGQVIKGKDFANNDDDPMDDNGHGTHTAGTMAALTNNNTGVAGIASGCKILAVKVMDAQGSGDISAICNGIDYAVKKGAKVINLSLGGPQESQTLHASIQAAAKAGVLVVAAAGNDGQTNKNYPAGYPEVLSVGATDENDAKAEFSTYGSWVRIAAPGTKILSTYKGAYKNLDGTSMASPHVAGAAALLRSLHPEWTIEQVANTLIQTGDACTGFEDAPSLRRLNLAKAVGAKSASAPAPAAPAAPAPVADQPQWPGGDDQQPQWPGAAPGGQPTVGNPWGMPGAQPVGGMPAGNVRWPAGNGWGH